MNPEVYIVAATAIAVGLILAAAGLGSALGWGLISAKTIEGITRQPEMRAQLMTNTFIFAGLMESFPFIVLAMAMWFVFGNPFLAAIR
ncbi:F0F1 ATP synthase subunit C [Thermithiobacillus plumbiphilus]|uniref:ATP synthase subunit c n=1 Tax=Thermithiobacillus plumbiphilus TaxID=1729899 RepID=A0ABU9DB04_9PROT